VIGLIVVSACGRSGVGVETARVDQIFATWNTPASPGCSLGVSRDGSVVYERGYGMADLEQRTPIAPSSIFHVASISKQFTAMSIMLLAARGQLSIDDDVGKYVPEWADKGRPITIRHLLNHTSGLRDVFFLLGLVAPRDYGDDRNETIAPLLAHQRGLNFPPGSEYQYNNGGYLLLANIVKRASGQSLRAFADANIFKPLGMSSTHFHDDPAMAVPNRALGYHRDGSGFRPARHEDLGRLVGNTGLFTTTGDLLRWEQNFADPRVGDQATLAAMQTPTILANGVTNPYGFGLQIDHDLGLQTVGHGGGDPGYRAQVMRYPERGLAVAVLCNLDDIDAVALAKRVAAVYLGDQGMPTAAGPTVPSSRVTLTADELSSKAGLYRDPAKEIFGRVFVRDGKLIASPNAGADDGVELVPADRQHFVIAGTTIRAEFVPPAAGRPQQIRVTGAGPTPIVTEQVTSTFTPAAPALRVFAGKYVSRELEVTYAIRPGDGGLILDVPGRTPIALAPIFPDAFHGDLVDVIEFSRDTRHAVTGFTINTDGVRRLRFERVSL
jgi:CubicO group peptidase (beta-lactamase class C family)